MRSQSGARSRRQRSPAQHSPATAMARRTRRGSRDTTRRRRRRSPPLPRRTRGPSSRGRRRVGRHAGRRRAEQLDDEVDALPHGRRGHGHGGVHGAGGDARDEGRRLEALRQRLDRCADRSRPRRTRRHARHGPGEQPAAQGDGVRHAVEPKRRRRRPCGEELRRLRVRGEHGAASAPGAAGAAGRRVARLAAGRASAAGCASAGDCRSGARGPGGARDVDLAGSGPGRTRACRGGSGDARHGEHGVVAECRRRPRRHEDDRQAAKPAAEALGTVSKVAGSTLPFTGFPLWLVLAAALALIGAGAALRRRGSAMRV